jgi:hypothetical protein
MALAAIVRNLQFKSRDQYQAALRKLAVDHASIRATLMGFSVTYQQRDFDLGDYPPRNDGLVRFVVLLIG